MTQDDPSQSEVEGPSPDPVSPPSDDPEARPTPERFPYGAGEILLGPAGFVAPRGRFRGEQFVAYRDVTHVAMEPRAVAIGTTRAFLLLGRAELGGDAAAHAFTRALLARVLALPDAARRREAMARLDRKLTGGAPRVAIALIALAAICYGLQVASPAFFELAIYRARLVELGEQWRSLTTQFLHGNLAHLVVNSLAILVAGRFVERATGRAATLLAVGGAALGTTIASSLAHYDEVIGASGIAAGLFGALTALEFFAPQELPAQARVPRELLVAVLLAQVALDRFLPQMFPAFVPPIAGAAHIGGFVGGALAALLARAAAQGFVRLGALATAAATAAAFGALGVQLANPSAALERQARALLAAPVVNPGELNNLAWAIATSKRPSEAALATATELAEAAVALTGGAQPTILDTLAEVYFAQGRKEDALEVIDQAIELAPGESYYAEQRRRFAGERAANDRPDAPPEQPSEPRGPRDERSDEPDERELPDDFEFPPWDEITV
ncbi:MAG: rhomboid family intramembrane serine protease [Deltaproteobacteria bacterium]|nr:rhomboid family intramembrane serine protease [Deltaproteobacteria bacterium]